MFSSRIAASSSRLSAFTFSLASQNLDGPGDEVRCLRDNGILEVSIDHGDVAGDGWLQGLKFAGAEIIDFGGQGLVELEIAIADVVEHLPVGQLAVDAQVDCSGFTVAAGFVVHVGGRKIFFRRGAAGRLPGTTARCRCGMIFLGFISVFCQFP